MSDPKKTSPRKPDPDPPVTAQAPVSEADANAGHAEASTATQAVEVLDAEVAELGTLRRRQVILIVVADELDPAFGREDADPVADRPLGAETSLVLEPLGELPAGVHPSRRPRD